MGRKGIVTSIFSKLVDASPRGGQQTSPPWPWPSSCGGADPQTTSFRASGGGDEEEERPCSTSAVRAGRRNKGVEELPAGSRLQLRGAAGGEMYKTVNSVYFDDPALEGDGDDGGEEAGTVMDDDESCFSTTTASEEWSEAVIRSLGRSTSTGHRFFFDPGPLSNSILPAPAPASTTTTGPPPTKPSAPAPGPEQPDPEEDDDEHGGKKQQQHQQTSSALLAEGSVAVAVDSADPFGDFRASMAEMVSAHGLRDWAALEELLSWYLRINGKHNHPVIVGAFVDLLVGLAASPSTTTTTSSSCTTTTGKSSATTSTSTTTTTSVTTTATGAAASRRAFNEASCSSSSSSCAAPDDDSLSLLDVVVEVKAAPASDPGSDDDRITLASMSEC